MVDGTTGAVELYINGGYADNSVTGDGIQFADIGEPAMHYHSFSCLRTLLMFMSSDGTDGDGLDDYLFIDEDGKVTAYVNGGAQSDVSLGWIWYPQNNGNPIATGIGSKRSQIHFADVS